MSDLFKKFEALHRNLLTEIHQKVFLDADRHSRLRGLAMACVENLQVARASVWRLNDHHDAIECEILYQNGRIEQGARLLEADFPHYFAALKQTRLINADDAETDPRTREFTDVYLKPLNIRAMLDTPIFFAGKLEGVLCLEHIGNPRQWDLAELSFATAVADAITLSNEHDAWLKAAQEVDYLAHFNNLTGLANRRMLVSNLTTLLNTDSPLRQHALVMLDLDRFKHINDSYGHPVGDELLRQVAHRLSRFGLAGDCMIFHLGGDEFALLIEDFSDFTSLDRLLKESLLILNTPMVLQQVSIEVQASAGVALFPKDARNADELLRYAEVAMYRAKSEGRGRMAFFASEWSVELMQRVQLEKELRYALSHQEIIVFYQPIINFQSKKVVAMEALVRWRHPQRGVLPPAVFLPLINEMGLMWEMGEQVLDQACCDMKKLEQAGINLEFVSVNLAAEQLQSDAIISLVQTILNKHHLASHKLELEIIEDLIGQDTKHIEFVLNAIVRLGVGMAIDDFGTGYSSLSRLKHMPVRKVKIDKTFVDGLPDDANDCSISQSIIGLANGLNMAVLAEGVETKEQAQWLFDKGCIYLQGYWFSRPLPLDEIKEYILRPLHNYCA